MTRPVARGAFKRSCQTCGWSGVYRSAAKANYCKRQHSCARRLAKSARAQGYAEKLSRIDRSPKPCLHKRAAHEHGTNACYVLDGCRCYPCSGARVEQDRMRSRAKAYGRYDKYLPADPVRQHLADLAEYGIGLKTVSKISGVSNGSLTKIVYGAYAPSAGPHRGCKGNGVLLRGPARRVLRTTAEAVYAVEAIPSNLGPRQPDFVRTPTARQHLRALVAIGWSMNRLGSLFGMDGANLHRVITQQAPMGRETVDSAEALYSELSMTRPPEDTQQEKQAASRARNFALARGWLPPLALDDDDPELYASLTIDELVNEGLSLPQIAGVLGCAAEDVENYFDRRIWRGPSLDVAS